MSCGDVNREYPNLFACGSVDGSVYFYDLSSLAVISSLKTNPGGVGHLFFNGHKLITLGFEDKKICFFHLQKDKNSPIWSSTIKNDSEAMFVLELENDTKEL